MNTLKTRPWITVPHEVLAGQDLDAMPDSGNDVEVLISPREELRAKVLSQNEFMVAVFQATNGVTRATGYPGDEIAIVLSGSTTLTDSPSGKANTFGEGDVFLVPRGWRGTWANNGTYRELVVMSSGWQAFLSGQKSTSGSITTSPSVLTIDADRSPEAFETVDHYGEFVKCLRATPWQILKFYSGEIDITVEALPQGGAHRFSSNPHEIFVYVLEGTTTIDDGNGTRTTYNPEEAFIVTRSFKGDWEFSQGYRGLVVTVHLEQL